MATRKQIKITPKATLIRHSFKEKVGYHLDLNLVWNDNANFRKPAAETFRIAALISDCSESAGWSIDAHENPGSLGRNECGTWIRIEFAEGDAQETASARQVLEAAIAEYRRITK